MQFLLIHFSSMNFGVFIDETVIIYWKYQFEINISISYGDKNESEVNKKQYMYILRTDSILHSK